MDDPNITMKEYIRLDEEKARRHAIVFDDTFTSPAALSCEPMVSPLNDNEIDFRISFDKSDDEDYTYDANGAQGCSGTKFGEAVLDLDTARALQFQLGGVRGDFPWVQLHLILDLVVFDCLGWASQDVGSVNIPHLLARYLRLFASGRKSRAMISRGQFICEEPDDTWAWVAPGPERQQVVTTGALEAPQPLPAARPVRTMAQRLVRLEEDVHGLRGALGEEREVLDSMVRDFSQFATWTVTGLSRMMDQDGVRYTSYLDYHIPYVRCTMRKTDDASTPAARPLTSISLTF
ncbi:hypothetical protein Tco_1516047 [Tanacetum coccineum]